MRVARRVRPSQVGYGASVARRRIYAASILPEVPAAEPVAAPRIAVIIHPDWQISSPHGPFEYAAEPDHREYVFAPELSGSSSRGR
jgi:hypothetical protein